MTKAAAGSRAARRQRTETGEHELRGHEKSLSRHRPVGPGHGRVAIFLRRAPLSARASGADAGQFDRGDRSGPAGATRRGATGSRVGSGRTGRARCPQAPPSPERSARRSRRARGSRSTRRASPARSTSRAARSTMSCSRTITRQSTRRARWFVSSRRAARRTPIGPTRVSSSSGGVKTPALDTVWTADAKTLTPEPARHAHLGQWRGPRLQTRDRGRRQIHVHDHRLRRRIQAAPPVTLRPYGLVLRHGMPNVAGYSVLHEGFEGVIGDGSEHAVDLRCHRQGHRQGRDIQGRRRLARLHRQVLGLGGHSRADRADRGPLLRQRNWPAGGLPGRFRRRRNNDRPGRVVRRPPRASSPARKRSARFTITSPSSASRSSI